MVEKTQSIHIQFRFKLKLPHLQTKQQGVCVAKHHIQEYENINTSLSFGNLRKGVMYGRKRTCELL